MFVYLSDNGILVGEHGLQGKDLPYDGALRVPVVVRWDGHVAAGSVDGRLALNIDVAPTLAAASGAAMTTDGLDLLAALTRAGFPIEAAPGYRGRPAYCGWRTRRWMYVRYDTGRSQLYDYRTDPLELRDRAADPSLKGVRDRLRAKAVEQCSPEPPGFDW